MHAILTATALLFDDYPATRRADQKRPDVLVHPAESWWSSGKCATRMLHQAFKVPEVPQPAGK